MRLVEVQNELTNERDAFSAVLARQQQRRKHSKASQHKHRRSSQHAHDSTHDRNKRNNNSTTHSDSSDCDSDSSCSDRQHEHDNELFVLGDATDDTKNSKANGSALDCSRSSSSSMISLQGNKAQHLHAYLSAKARHVSQLRRESQEWQRRCIAACSKWSQLTKQNADLQAKIQHQSVALSLRDETIATLQTLLHSKDAQLTTLHSTVAELATTTTASTTDGGSSINSATAASVKRKQVCC
jgi:hypothetical protein